MEAAVIRDLETACVLLQKTYRGHAVRKQLFNMDHQAPASRPASAQHSPLDSIQELKEAYESKDRELADWQEKYKRLVKLTRLRTDDIVREMDNKVNEKVEKIISLETQIDDQAKKLKMQTQILEEKERTIEMSEVAKENLFLEVSRLKKQIREMNAAMCTYQQR